MDFLQNSLVWFSKIYLSVQSKICGQNSLFLFSFSEVFRILSKLFSDFWLKNFEKLSKLPSTCPEEHFVAWFFWSVETFRIFCRKIWHGSQSSIYVFRVKIAGKTVFFLFSFHIFFRILSKNFSDFRPKNLKKFSKLPTCTDE